MRPSPLPSPAVLTDNFWNNKNFSVQPRAHKESYPAHHTPPPCPKKKLFLSSRFISCFFPSPLVSMPCLFVCTNLCTIDWLRFVENDAGRKLPPSQVSSNTTPAACFPFASQSFSCIWILRQIYAYDNNLGQNRNKGYERDTTTP